MEAGALPADLGSAGWPTTSLLERERLGKNIWTACGFLDNKTADKTPGVVSSTFVRGGRIFSPRANEAASGEDPHPRAALRAGDLAVVLVRRTGDSALVTSEHAGWPAARSIGATTPARASALQNARVRRGLVDGRLGFARRNGRPSTGLTAPDPRAPPPRRPTSAPPARARVPRPDARRPRRPKRKRARRSELAATVWRGFSPSGRRCGLRPRPAPRTS